ncbi:hypothetical protein XA68_18466 [Ophiocordyceps unilateralis]|uniref:Major facilitator superfamily (MFS) profile domain-containing protein n=1 Tax=Ophiocordyceps unilateralis TaxID=268505 RepID=A0A2A9PJD4_OPHUN|nr:hypothetical protein XA68_18466 [Ophiocordyceps unilateralis]
MMDWAFRNKPVATIVAEPPLARYPPSSSLRSLSTIRSLPMTGSSHSLSFASEPRKSHVVKYGSGRDADVELIPQPSDAPDDPLNWPLWRKHLNLASLLVSVVLVGGMKTALLPTAGSRHGQVSVAALTSVPLALAAVGGIGSCVAAKRLGKRPLYLASAVVALIGCVWSAATADDGFASSVGARVLQGLGWGAFDTLLLGSIQDTYFEHERNLPVTLYNMLTTASTWATPLIAGLSSSLTPANPPAAPFRLISALHLVSLPLLLLGAPETVFDRSGPGPVVSGPAPPMQLAGYVRHVIRLRRPWSSSSASSALQAARAIVAPSTCLVSALSAVPYAALWGLAAVGAMVVTPQPLGLGPVAVGALLSGPWLLASAVVGGLACFYRGFHDRFTRRASCIVVAVGAFLVVVGLLSFGLGLDNFMIRAKSSPASSPPFFTPTAARQLSPPLLALQLGILAAGIHVLDTATRPLLARSASFTSPTVAAAHRSIGDMHAAIVAIRSLAAAIGIAALPAMPLRPAVIAMTVVHTLVVPAVLFLCSYAGEAVWRADGRVLGQVDVRLLKQSGSFFDHD